MGERLIKIGKAALGATVSTAAALALGLKFAPAAGIITLLSLQDTKKETLLTAFRRVLVFLAAVFLAWISFSLLGYTVWGLGLYFLLFVGLCVCFSMENSIAMISVLVTHFWIEQTMAPTLLANEALLLLVGAGVGVALNLFLPVSKARILALQQEVEEHFRTALAALAEALICGVDCVENFTKDTEALAALEQSLQNAQKRAERAAKNALFSDLRYYIEYVDLRHNQFLILRRMQKERARLSAFPAQAGEIAALLRQVAETFRETNNAQALLVALEGMRVGFRQSELPKTREEFEARATLFTLFLELEHLLLLKQAFVRGLTDEQKRPFWTV